MTMTTRTIDTYCAERAAELRAKGWEDGGAEYDIGAYFGDREGWEDEIGRTLETGEVLALERGIRRALDIAHAATGGDLLGSRVCGAPAIDS